VVTHSPSTVATTLHYDEEAARRLETMYTHPDVVERRRRVRQALAIQPGARVLDIGCGPGFQTTEIATAVGPQGWVCGVDISEAGLAAARHRAAGQPYAAWIDFAQGDATELPFPDDAFDLAVATQVYEYVPEVPAALAEMHRVLRPGGRAVIVDTDWDSLVWHSADPDRMSRVLAAWDEHLTDPFLPRTLRLALARAGLNLERVETLNVLNLAWGGYSQGLAGLVAAFVAGRRGLTAHDASEWLADVRGRDDEGSYFFSLDQYLFLVTKSES
jgi:ubiquinone/menaquinone biosynthesis C-methylase UbiE